LSAHEFPTLKDVIEAKQVVHKYLKRTPLIYSRSLSKMLECDAYLKLENLQPTRAFKVRGGVYFMVKKLDEALKRGVVTASTGNHAQSIAYAGSLFGVDVKVVMPEGVPAIKQEATRALGAQVLIHGRYFDEANEYAKKLAEKNSNLYIHSINEPLLYPGVATMHWEVIEELPEVEVVINPIGGGSGICGACIVYKTIDSKIKVIGVQASGAPAFYKAWLTGELVNTGGVKTEAEGLATASAYQFPLRIVRGTLDDIVLVEDSEMFHAVRILLFNTGQLAELAGAASTAAALKIKQLLTGKKVVLMLTGGNISEEKVKKILNEQTL